MAEVARGGILNLDNSPGMVVGNFLGRMVKSKRFWKVAGVAALAGSSFVAGQVSQDGAVQSARTEAGSQTIDWVSNGLINRKVASRIDSFTPNSNGTVDIQLRTKSEIDCGTHLMSSENGFARIQNDGEYQTNTREVKAAHGVLDLFKIIEKQDSCSPEFQQARK